MGFFRKTKVEKPRKQYRCNLCGQTILGSHTYVAMKSAGYDFFSMRVHDECQDRSEVICGKCGDSGYCDNDPAECFIEGLAEWYDGLVALAKEKDIGFMVADDKMSHLDGFTNGDSPKEELENQIAAAQ